MYFVYYTGKRRRALCVCINVESVSYDKPCCRPAALGGCRRAKHVLRLKSAVGCMTCVGFVTV